MFYSYNFRKEDMCFCFDNQNGINPFAVFGHYQGQKKVKYVIVKCKADSRNWMFTHVFLFLPYFIIKVSA